jgi:TonB-linked SusC/RagA family outer membrane protein
MRKSMRKFSRVLLLSFSLMFFSAMAFAQNAVTGRVTDSKDGTPVAGITVTVKGTRTATQTTVDGSFKINAAANATLVFSGIGFARQEIAVNSQAAVQVSMVQSNQQLNEVVVVAYGTRRRTDLTSLITSVGAKDFQKGAIASPEQLLQGKVAGLQITSGGGSAGGGSTIRIRGGASLNASNDPLIVIDGVPVDNNNLPGSSNLLNTINPNDIESISVLKDASATALYGSRASNGVIIITTKKGTKGKVKFNFNTQISAGMIAKKVDVLTADQIRDIINTDAAASGSNTFKSLLGSANTDWQSEIYQTAIGNDNNLSASGSVANIPFRISAGYLNQDGILKTDHFDRLSTALNLSPKLLDDHLSINLNVKYSNTKNRFADGGAVGSAVSFDPTQPVKDDPSHNAGRWGGYFEWLQPGTTLPIDLSTRNPVALLELRHNTSTVNRVIGNAQLDYKLHFFPDLHIQANIGVDYGSGSGNDKKDSIMATDYHTLGRYTYYKQSKQNTLAEVSLFYSKEMKRIKSKIDVLALHGYEDFVTNVNNYASYGQDGTVIATSVPTFATDKPEYILESYLGRINYSYNNKFYLTGSVRRDASSIFPSQPRRLFPGGFRCMEIKRRFL